jgi:2-polyprenyl-3-methyl-5-hydroxy-6-metoxy-1,4-benzoquinol methylase
MDHLSDPELYDRSIGYMPYAESVATVLEHVALHAPKKAHVLDVMCGTGSFLGQLHAKRPDLICHGTDLSDDFVGYANARYPGITFEQADIVEMDHIVPADVVTCLGALHHVEYDLQPTAMLNLASMVKPSGFAVISDCYIDDYRDETERMLAAEILGREYLQHGLECGAPDDIQALLRDIMRNDVEMLEFKTSIERRLPILKTIFKNVGKEVETMRTWPKESSGYGDYIHFCS